jgi:hypothetical protein
MKIGLPKYKKVPWAKLNKEYHRTIFLCITTYWLAFCTWAAKGRIHWVDVLLGFLCGLYVGTLMMQYLIEKHLNSEKMQQSIKEMTTKAFNEALAVLEAEKIKQGEEGEEWKK